MNFNSVRMLTTPILIKTHNEIVVTKKNNFRMKSLCIDNDDMTTLMFNESSSVVAAMVTNRLVFIQLSDDEYTYSLVQAAQHTQSILVRGPVKGYNRLCRNDLRIQQFHVTFAKYTRNENNNDEHDDEKDKIIIIIIII